MLERDFHDPQRTIRILVVALSGWRSVSWFGLGRAADGVGGDVGSGDVRRTALVFASLRIFVGVIWLANLGWKLPPDFGRRQTRGLLYSFSVAERWAVVEPLRHLVHSVVIPHFTLFGWLVFTVELTAGVLLVLGFQTRVGALLGTAESVAIMALVARAPTEWFWGYAMFVVFNLLPLLAPAHPRLSIDNLRRRS